MIMRPASIVNFERVVLLLIAISLGAAALGWDRSVAELERAGIGSGALIGMLAFVTALLLLLMWLIARRGSGAAKWVYVALTLIIIATSVPSLSQIARQGAAGIALNAAYLLLSVVSVWLLFRPDSRGWFRSDESTLDR
jgi:hypothetical protein